MDPIPVLSQVKSFIQWICGDSIGARQTQINFSRQCPVISQARSAVEAAKGDQEAARETQIEFCRFLGALANGIPVVGHVKGSIHYALKDKDEGDVAMKAASHTTAVVGGGVGGFLIGGPVGAVAGGIGAGVAIDATITGADSAINKKFKPYGVVEPLGDPTNPGKWCDAAGGIALDGLTGKFAGNMTQVVKMKIAPKPGVAADSVFQKVIIPVPITVIINEIKLMLKTKPGKIFVRILKEKAPAIAKAAIKFTVGDKSNEASGEENEHGVPRQKDDPDKLTASFTHTGDGFEFHYEGELVLVKNRNNMRMNNGRGELVKIKDGPEYCLCSDDIFVAENERGEKTTSEQDKWFHLGNELAMHKCVTFMYDYEGRIITWRMVDGKSRSEEEHHVFFSPRRRESKVIELR